MGKICPTCSVTYEDGSVFCPADGTTLRSLQPDQDDLLGTVIADRYLLTEKLGEGGMGRVYLARHVRVPRQAAIKVLRHGLADDYRLIAGFNREANNAAKMGNHPHVAEVYDFGETAEGLVYLAMEYVPGEPLSRLLERESVLPPRRAAEIARQVAEALTVAHELPVPVIHRDLKPDNIMLARSRDGGDWVKVVDFGIAKAISGETQALTSPGLAVGTPRYMSPEQLTAADNLDPRSDIYSLGFITFQMLTGKMPFPSESATEESTLQWAVRRLVTPPIPLARVKGDVAWPSRLQLVFDRALALSPDDRYVSAEMFARDLVEAIDELEAARPKPVTPPSPPPARRSKPSRRVVLAVSAGAVVVLGIGMLAASLRRGTGDNRQNTAATAQAVGPARSDRVVSAGGDLAGVSRPAAPNVDSFRAAHSDQPSTGVPGRTDGVDTSGKSNTRVARPTPAPRETTAVSAIGHETAAEGASNARAALDSIDRVLSNASTLTPEEATRILEALRRIRPNLDKHDDLRAQLYAAEALLVFQETAEACKLFRAVERDGVGTEAANMAQRYLYPPKDRPQLNCPP
jgi:serine/threonine-protein kinase